MSRTRYESPKPTYQKQPHHSQPPMGSTSVFEWRTFQPLIDFSDKSLTEVFKQISADIIERPYHYDPHRLIDSKGNITDKQQAAAKHTQANNIQPPAPIHGVAVYKQNHGTGHALRQMVYTDKLIEVIAHEGNPKGQAIAQKVNNNEQIKSALKIAAYCKRIGRVYDHEHDEIYKTDSNKPTIYSKRSADMFAKMATELGFDKDLIQIVSDGMLEPIPKNLGNVYNNIDGIDGLELREFSKNVLMAAHKADLTRLFPVNLKLIDDELGAYFAPTKLNEVTKGLVEMACSANALTGNAVAKQAPGVVHTHTKTLDGAKLVWVVNNLDKAQDEIAKLHITGTAAQRAEAKNAAAHKEPVNLTGIMFFKENRKSFDQNINKFIPCLEISCPNKEQSEFLAEKLNEQKIAVYETAFFNGTWRVKTAKTPEAENAISMLLGAKVNAPSLQDQLAAQKAAEQLAAQKAAEQLAAQKAAEQLAAQKAAEQLAAQKAAEQLAAQKAAEQLAAQKAAEQLAAQKAAEQLAAQKAAEQLAAQKAAEQLAAQKAAEQLAAQKIPVNLTGIMFFKENRKSFDQDKKGFVPCLEISCPNKEQSEFLAKKLAEQKIAVYEITLFKGTWRIKTAKTPEAENAISMLLGMQINAPSLQDQLAAQKAAEQLAAQKAAEQLAAQKAAEQLAAQKAAEQLAAQKAAEQLAAQKAAEQLAAQKAAEQLAAQKAAEAKTQQGQEQPKGQDENGLKEKVQSMKEKFQGFKNDPNQIKHQTEFNKHLASLKEKLDQFELKRDEAPYEKAYQAMNTLYKGLEKTGSVYFSEPPTQAKYEQFKSNCNELFKDARPELETHRGLAKIIVNIVAAIVTLGVGYAIAAGVDMAMNKGRFTLFSTDSAKKVNDAEDAIESMRPNI